MPKTDLEVRNRAGNSRPICRQGQTRPIQLGDWTLVEMTAAGNLACLYRAHPAEGACETAAYAVKVLRDRWENDPRAIQLFAREALVGRSVSHPHVIPVLCAHVARPPRYLVMPWLEGTTLRCQLDAGWPFDLPVALWMARQAAEGLQALHAAGWMHGDIKPSNLFVSPEGHVTLLDLSFARRRHEVGSAVHRCVTGTCSYMAPELITSSLAADIRSDLYSVGVVLYELLGGRLPFSGTDLAEVAQQHQQARPTHLRRLAPHLPAEVVELVHQLLAKQPLRRPQTPKELVERLIALEIATFSERSWA